MSLETTDRLSDPVRRKKRDAVEVVKRTSEDDHRRKRRNRTTQSCLNCHTSKRMCDRKRPCGRCTQLGLTGLCIYEVDDPSPSYPQDETLRLQKRVAELESIIRELKNKPHPRWIKSTKDAADVEKRRTSRTNAARTKAVPDIVVCDTTALSPVGQVGGSPPATHLHPDRSFETYNRLSLDLNGSSPSPLPPASPSTDSLSSPLLTPTSPSLSPPNGHILALGAQTCDIGPDLSALLSSYLVAQGGIEDNAFDDIFHQLAQSDMHVDDHMGDHCGCLNDPTNYHVVLELSLRLRRAADMLTRFSEHESGSRYCAISQNISELDRFTSLALGNITTPPELISPYSTVMNGSPNPASSVHYHGGILPGSLAPTSTAGQSPYGLQSGLPWGVEGPATHGHHRDDTLMSWDPSRLRQ